MHEIIIFPQLEANADSFGPVFKRFISGPNKPPNFEILEILKQRTEAVKYRGKYFGSD